MEKSTAMEQDISGTISLTEHEKRIFSEVFTVAKKHNLSTVFRVAGGWVRDKV